MLYFDNLSRDSAYLYLSDGLTEEITSRLGQIERLHVQGRSAVRRAQHSVGGDLPTLARALQVRWLVEGSVRHAGDRLRVAVRLLRADGFQVWSENYERTMSDLLTIEEQIAREVTTNIAGRLLPQERRTLTVLPTRSAAAYDHFVRGNFYLARRSVRGFVRAKEEYEAALRLDPQFARARARLAYLAGVMLDNQLPSGVHPESVLAQGLATAQRAVREDSTDSDAWLALGYLLSYRHPRTFEGVQAAFTRAIALNPRNAEAHHQYAWILALLGQDSLAIAEAFRALSLDPGRAITFNDLAVMHLVARRYAEALRWADSANAVEAGVAAEWGFDAAWYLGDTVRARLLAEALRPAWGTWRLDLLAARADDSAAARRVRATIIGWSWSGKVDSLPPNAGAGLASVFVLLGDHNQGLEVLARARPRGARLWFWLRQPALDPVRDDPRFRQIVAESRPPGAP